MKPVFSKPKIVVPAAFGVALIVGAVLLPRVGRPPAVDPGLSALVSDASSAAASSVSLAFNASGRVQSVGVKAGDKVAKGQVLAALDAGTAAGAVSQAKGALDLAKAQFGSLSVQYKNAQAQQNTLVQNAWKTLVSSGLAASPVGVNDESHNPVISGTYACDKEGSYLVSPYPSGYTTGFSFNAAGLEVVNGGGVTYGTPQPLGSCGLSITFVPGFIASSKWEIDIPNAKSPAYQANKNAYDLAVATRDQVLSQLAANLGQGSNGADADVANAQISAAQGAYDAAVAAYGNTIIVSPAAGSVSFVDASLKVGQSAAAGRPVITISPF